MTSDDGTEHEVVAPAQSDLERYLEAVRKRYEETQARPYPTAKTCHASIADVKTLLALVRYVLAGALNSHTVFETQDELNRLAREAMGEADA